MIDAKRARMILNPEVYPGQKPPIDEEREAAWGAYCVAIDRAIDEAREHDSIDGSEQPWQTLGADLYVPVKGATRRG
jgi:hypothetical protein